MALRMSLSESLRISSLVEHDIATTDIDAMPRGGHHRGRRQQQQQQQLQSSKQKQQQQAGILVKVKDYIQLMLLVASLAGTEMVMAFEQIYGVLFMQFLGVPVSLVSLNGVLCGAGSMCILPGVGWCIDRGSKPKLRKMLALYIGMGLFLTGMLFLFICGMLRLEPSNSGPYSMVNTHDPTNHNTSWLFNNGSEKQYRTNLSALFADAFSESYAVRTTFPLGNTSSDEDSPPVDRVPTATITTITTTTRSTTMISTSTTTASSPPPPTTTTTTSTEYLPSDVAVTATLAILAFCFGDMGFDMSNSLTRAYVLECVTGSQHTRILLLATTTQATAGMLFCCFGLFDFPAIFRAAFGVDGTAATILFFSTLLFSSTLFCFGSTTITGYFMKQGEDETNIQDVETDGDTQQLKESPLEKGPEISKDTFRSDSSAINATQPRKVDTLYTGESSTSTRAIILEDGRGTIETKFSRYLGQSADDLERDGQVTDTDERSPLIDKSNSASKDRHPFHTEGVVHRSSDDNGIGTGKRGCLRMDKRLLAIVISEFFACGSLLTFALYVANALTIGILHGDPTAPEGSPGRMQYESGLQIAAAGNLIHYASYFLISLVNDRIIDILGPKLQSVLGHLGLMAMTLTLSLTKSLPVYYVSMVVMGFYRPCVYTVPFVLANRYARDTSNGPDASAKNIGRMMSLVGFQMPFHYLVLSAVVGPLIDATGNVFVPILYCCAATTLSFAAFSTLFFMKDS